MKQAAPLLPMAYHGGEGIHAAEHGGAGAERDRERAAEPKCSRAAGQAVRCQQSFWQANFSINTRTKYEEQTGV